MGYEKAADHYLTKEAADYQTVYTVCKNLIDALNAIADHAKLVMVTEKLLPIILAQPTVNDEHYYDIITSKGQSLFLLRRYSESDLAFAEASSVF